MLQVSEGTDDAATSYLVHLLSDLNTLLKKVSSDVRHQGDNSCGYVKEHYNVLRTIAIPRTCVVDCEQTFSFTPTPPFCEPVPGTGLLTETCVTITKLGCQYFSLPSYTYLAASLATSLASVSLLIVYFMGIINKKSVVREH